MLAYLDQKKFHHLLQKSSGAFFCKICLSDDKGRNLKVGKKSLSCELMLLILHFCLRTYSFAFIDRGKLQDILTKVILSQQYYSQGAKLMGAVDAFAPTVFLPRLEVIYISKSVFCVKIPHFNLLCTHTFWPWLAQLIYSEIKIYQFKLYGSIITWLLTFPFHSEKLPTYFSLNFRNTSRNKT